MTSEPSGHLPDPVPVSLDKPGPSAPAPYDVSDPVSIPLPCASAAFPSQGPGSLGSFGARFVARMIDLVLIGVVFALLTFLVLGPLLHIERIGQPGGPGLLAVAGTLLLLALVLGVLYGLYEVVLTARTGETLGKKIMGLAAVSRDSRQPLGLGPSFVRFISTYIVTLIAAFLPVIGLIAPIVDELWALVDPLNQTLHDKAANSVVIRTR